MKLSSKLDFLMKIFGSNNSKLAKAINVDPSLVSKWRNGSRVLNPCSPYLPMMADYFLYIASLQNRNDSIVDILRQIHPDVDSYPQLQIEQLFIQWFASGGDYPEPERNPPLPSVRNPGTDVGIGNILARLNLLSPQCQETPAASDAFLNAWTRKGDPGNYELFKGGDGKRQVVMNILNMVQQAREPVELLFLDEASLDWLVGDKDFYYFFGNSLRSLILQGHRLKIIHHVKRSPSQLAPIIDFWLPLHMTGGVESYYYPRYTDSGHRKTLCAARGMLSAVAIYPEEETEDSFLMVFSDPMLVKLGESMFNSYLARCRPLIRTFLPENFSGLYEELCGLEEKIGSSYSLKNGLTSLTMPPEVYRRMLDKTGASPREKKSLLDMHARRVKNFEANLFYNKYVEIINSDLFDRLNQEILFQYDRLELFSCSDVTCEPEDLIAHIANMIELLRKYDNYEVVLLRVDGVLRQDKFTLACKGDSYAMATIGGLEGDTPVAMLLDEEYVVKGVEKYLLSLIEYVPESKCSKKCVLKRLENFISMLEARTGNKPGTA